MTAKINFTQAAIAALQPDSQGKRLVFYDTNTHGLTCRVSPSGVKTFSVYRKLNGRPERITIGKFPTISVLKARKLADTINGSIATGDNPAQVKRAIKEELTLDELFNLYLNKHAKPRNRTAKQDEGQYNVYLRKTLGNRKLSSIERTHVVQLLTSITSQVKLSKSKKKKKDENIEVKYKSGTTANRVLGLLSSIFNWGISVGECQTNPAKGIKKNPERSRDRFLQADELPRFFESLAKEENGVIRDFILIALLTGARRENVLSMSWKDISFERKEWLIPRTKNGDPQTVPLDNEAIKILSARKVDNEKIITELQLGTSDFVFPGAGKLGYLAEPKKGWNRILKRANITNLRIHDLRRTLGSWQARTGASLVIVGKSLGHKSLQSTAVYARLDLNPVRKSMRAATVAIYAAAKKRDVKAIFNTAAKLPDSPTLLFLPFQTA